MKLEDFEKTKKELFEQKKINDERINIHENKRRLIYANRFEYKGIITLGFSFFTGVLLWFVFQGLASVLGTAAFTNVIPFLPPILLGSSLGVGITLQKIITKKYNRVKKFEQISDAKTETEKIEEELVNVIETEKLFNRNKIIDKVLGVIGANELMLKSISNKYDISEKNIPTQIEAAQKINELSKTLQQQYEELDVLTTKYVLNDSFFGVRETFQKVMEYTLFPLISAVGLMGVVGLIFTPFGSTPFSYLLGSLALGWGGFLGYLIDSNKKCKKVFKNLNSKLGENALEEKTDVYKEKESILKLLEEKINNISAIEIQMQEYKRKMEEMDSNDKEKEEVCAIYNSKAFEVAEEKKEAFLNHEIDPVIRENNQRTLEKITPIIDNQVESGPVKKLGKKKN